MTSGSGPLYLTRVIWAWVTHWKVVLMINRILCLVTFGRTSLRPIWGRSHSMESGLWEEGRDSLSERIQHTNIIVSPFDFVVAGHSSIFVRWFAPYHDRGPLTYPPIDSKFLPYMKGAHACLLVMAFGLSFAGLMVGSTIVSVGKSGSTWFYDVSRGVSDTYRRRRTYMGLWLRS